MSIHIDILAELERRSVDKAAAELDKKFSQRTVQVGADVKATEIKAAAEKIKREFGDIRAEIKLDVDKTAAARLNDVGQGLRDIDRAGKSAQAVLSQLGKTAFQAGRGLLTVAAPPAIIALLDVVKAGTAATQALWLLPAAATAAGAGMATLQLATSGFADTIKDIRDPKKFAEDIQGLSPAAQQAALSIQNLLPAFDQLKNATQDAFFANMGEQINRLATTYLPSIQNLTTSIATSFNTMLTGVANQLMTPETQSNMQAMFENIGQAFRNLAPAAQPLIQAFTQIATVGSSFLPQLATQLANAATSFANFIDNASRTGQLQQWIQEGITAVEGLISVSGELIKIFYRVFGPENQAQVEQLTSDLHGISEAIGIVMGDGKTWSDSWADEMSGMTGAAAAFRDMVLDIPEAFEVAFDGVIKVLNGINHAINYMAKNAHDALAHILPGEQAPYQPIPDIPLTTGTMGDWGGYQDPRGPFGHIGAPSLGGPMGSQRERRGAGPVPSAGAGIPGASPYGGPFAVPPPPPGGPKASDRERRDAIIAGLDPSLYKVDPFAPVPGMPSPGQLAGGPMPGGGYGAASAQDFFEGQQKIIDQAHQLEESRKDRLALERDTEATAEQINDAKWKEHQDEVALQKAQADLVQKTQGTAKDLKSGMDQLGVALDPDFGLSKGLAGLAENLVKFLGNIAAAPMEAKLQAISNASPIQGGYGALGIMGAQNIAQGKSPLLGNPLTPEQQQAYMGSGGAGGGGYNTGGLGGAASNLYQPGSGSMGYAPLASGDTGGKGTGSGSRGGGFYAAGAGVPLMQLPDGTWTSPDPAWAHLIARESSGINQVQSPSTVDVNTGGNEAEGLFQITPKTWAAAGGTQFAPSAISATPQQQAIIAGRIFQNNPSGSDWGAGLAGREDPAALQAGLQGALAPPTAPSWTQPGNYHGPTPAPTDKTPVLLSPGEVVVPPGPLDPRLGRRLGMPGFAQGGWIDPNGNPVAAGPTPGPTQIGGISPGQANPGGGGVGMTPGGTLDTALGVAASGLDIIAPGAGQAAQMGIKLANRAIQYGGQLAGIGVQGLMETFLPTGASELANNSWLTRIAGGLAGVSPQIPNIAGGKGGQGQGQAPGPLTPQQVQPFGGQTASGQAPITVNYTANGVTEDRGGADVAANLRAQRENQALSGHR